jgi:hypothetical protein
VPGNSAFTRDTIGEGIFAGRATAPTPSCYVVFLIGMRVNRLFAVRKWMQVSSAMPKMLRELYTHPEMGFLGGETLLNWRGVTTMQYWKSFEHLHAYAHAKDAEHLPAWAAFNRAIGSDGSVGIWHETYLIDANHSESIYGNMPPWGLSRAFGRIPVTGVNDAARQRIGVVEGP